MTFILKYSGADRDYFIETLNKPLKPYEFIVAKFECKNEDIKQAKLDLFNTLVRRGLIRDSSNKNHLITCNRDDFRFYVLNQYHHDMFSKEKQMNELYMSMESDDSDNDESTDEPVSQNVSNNQISKFFVDSKVSIKAPVPTSKARKTNTDELLAYLSKNNDDSDEYSNEEDEDEEDGDEEINSTNTRRSIKMTVSKKINSLTDEDNEDNEDNDDSDVYSTEDSNEDEEGETFDDEDLLS